MVAQYYGTGVATVHAPSVLMRLTLCRDTVRRVSLRRGSVRSDPGIGAKAPASGVHAASASRGGLRAEP